MVPISRARLSDVNGEGRPRTPVIVGAALGAAFVLLPVVALIADAPLGSTLDVFQERSTGSALGLSLVVSTGALVLATLVGLPLAWVLARHRFAGRGWLRAMILVPMIIPPVVAGVGLLAAFGPEGLLGGFLADLGVRLPGTTFAACLASAFVGLPFLVVAAEAGFRSVDRNLEIAAATLGAGPGMVFRRVTLPAAVPYLSAGATLCWVRAVGEFGATVTFAGDVPSTRTASLGIYALLRQGSESQATLLSIVMLALTVLTLVFVRRYLWADDDARS